MNRILISMMDGMEEPSWMPNIEPYVIELLKKLSFDGEEISILFCNDEMIQTLNKHHHIIIYLKSNTKCCINCSVKKQINNHI